MQYLKVPYGEKNDAKALGARWDAAVTQWYVPDGIDLAAFSKWLPANTALAPRSQAIASSTTLVAADQPIATTDMEVPKGISLSQLLAGVSAAISAAFSEGLWVRAEIMKVDARNSNVYLELSERTPSGDVISTGRGFIAARTANLILPEFQRATGVTLGPGIKVLVRAKPIFSVRWGLSLEIDAIDAKFTLGDLAARMRWIRATLREEGVIDANKQLLAPEDFTRVLVIAPADAAGFGDFRADADRLQRHGVCDFIYAHSRFQGEGSAAEILSAVTSAFNELIARHGVHGVDAVVIIRGGGAVNDLAWLNDLNLARWVCKCPVPVFSGIGHERDSTIIDEVAHTRFDTPSKVIAGIRDGILVRVQRAVNAYDSVMTSAAGAVRDRRERSQRFIDVIQANVVSAVNQARLQTERLNANTRAGAQAQVASARQQVPLQMSDVKAGAAKGLAEARSTTERLLAMTSERAQAQVVSARQQVPLRMSNVKADAARGLAEARSTTERLLAMTNERGLAQVASARQQIPLWMSDVKAGAARGLAVARSTTERLFAITNERGLAFTSQAQALAKMHMGVVHDHSLLLIGTARTAAQGLFREVAGQGPRRTLARGFAIVRAQNRGPLTQVDGVCLGDVVEIELVDGCLDATVGAVKLGANEQWKEQ